MEKNVVARIYAPKPNSAAAKIITMGAGVVGFGPNDKGQVTVYFEGNLYNASNLHCLHERIKCAAGRLFQRYPTIAKAYLSVSDLVEIGAIDREYQVMITQPGEAERVAKEYEQSGCPD